MKHPDLITLRRHFQSLTKAEKEQYLKSLTKAQQIFFYRHPQLFLFDKQIIPDGTWRYLMLRCGRRFGKTVAGSAWIADKIIQGYTSLGLCGASYSDVVNVMVKHVINWFPAGECHYIGGEKHYINFISGPYQGTKVYCFSSDKEIRGPTISHLWCDEICNWSDQNPKKIQLRFDSIDTAVSEGKHPQTIITSTPKSFPFFFEFQRQIDNGNDNYLLMTGTMFDNPTLSDGFRKKELDKYKNNKSQLDQEIYGKLVFEDPGALFQKTWIDFARIVAPNNDSKDQLTDLNYFCQRVKCGEVLIKRGGVYIDPAITNGNDSDETGIILACQDYKNEIYILLDLSGRYTPHQWAVIVRNIFWKLKNIIPSFKIVAETNQGGDLVVSNLVSADDKLAPYIKQIKVSKGKLLRAEPVAAKYERNKVHHVGYFDTLEQQMCNYTGDNNQNSPDHMDAMVHAVNELSIVPQYTQRDIQLLNNY